MAFFEKVLEKSGIKARFQELPPKRILDDLKKPKNACSPGAHVFQCITTSVINIFILEEFGYVIANRPNLRESLMMMPIPNKCHLMCSKGISFGIFEHIKHTGDRFIA